jgi:DNA polymerase-3 subunit gamma/tau
MSSALYRRYRPQNFDELIGQSQVTDPLKAALTADRVNHAYLFSGPRGCGKTTSARILARCLNCHQGPTANPCGECESCVELGRGGNGSLDVVEIDAASHNGVDDARDLRERAIFAPARDRYKIFILDEAHMVTPQGFNALLKIVEEPPEHVKFIFATTEPDKVISTIRSRTHHYPFRLVATAEMLGYLEQVLESEGVTVEEGVLPLVVRAGGGSVRDTLSLLDQLVAGSENNTVAYERAVGLLGFTHESLLSEIIDAFASNDGAKAFDAIDRVIQTGQDARRFLDDLLERLRDLIIAMNLGDQADRVLRGMAPEQLERISIQAAKFGESQLSQIAETVNQSLQEFSGATSPRLHLELLCAKVLVSGNRDSQAPTAQVQSPPQAQQAPVSKQVPAPEQPKAPEPVEKQAEVKTSPKQTKVSEQDPSAYSAQDFKNNWDEVLERLAKSSRSAWAVAFTTKVVEYQDGVLTLLFQSNNDVENFKKAGNASELLRQQIFELMGVRVKYKARIAEQVKPEPTGSQPTAKESQPAEVSKTEPETVNEPEPTEEPQKAEEPVAEQPAEPEPQPEEKQPEEKHPEEKQGESVLRDVLGAKPVGED